MPSQDARQFSVDGQDEKLGTDAWVLGHKYSPRRVDAEVSENGAGIKWWFTDQSPPEPTRYQAALNNFISLDTPRQIVRFVKNYGILQLCKEHQEPIGHTEIIVGLRAYMTDLFPPCVPAKPIDTEPVRVWIDYATRFRTLLRLSKRVKDADESVLSDSAWNKTPLLSEPESLQDAKIKIGSNVNAYLIEGGVRPSLEWDGPRPGFGFEPDQMGLFGVLALQLAMAVASIDRVYTCSNCGVPYQRLTTEPKFKKRPKPGQRNYCEDCGRPAAVRDANRDLRERKRKIKEEHGNG